MLSVAEVHHLMTCLDGVYALMGRLIYGTGMRLMECLRLRVKDVDFDRHEITIREGKGGKDRVTMLPQALAAPLQAHLEKARALFDMDREAEVPGVEVPDALARKYPQGRRNLGLVLGFPCAGVIGRLGDRYPSSSPSLRAKPPAGHQIGGEKAGIAKLASTQRLCRGE